MMSGAFILVASVLALAGAAKVASPLPAAKALAAVGGPAGALGPMAIRILGLAEIIVGATAVGRGGAIPAAIVAAFYLGFAGFLVVALRTPGGLAACGCFGQVGAEPTSAHVVLDLGAAAIAVAAVTQPTVGIADFVAEQPAFGVPFLALIVVGVMLVRVIFSTGGQARAVDRVKTFSLAVDR